ncbi:MAG: hypothetical protein M3N34_00360 [Pseudomonadota bacterium]|nr:hypothetical protein [Pseudomonadota bacterium]
MIDLISGRNSATGQPTIVKPASNTDIAHYEQLVAGLKESREHLRVLQVSGEQQNVDLAKAFYRIDSAVASISELLAITQTLDLAPFPTETVTCSDRKPASLDNILSTALV